MFEGGVGWGLQFFGGGGGLHFFRGGSPNFWGVSNFSGVSTGIRSTFGRYASYWNALLYVFCARN